MLRYLRMLESRDLSLCHSMIPLGSCTMKLNATAEMIPITLPGFSDIHPFAPASQTTGYATLIHLQDALTASLEQEGLTRESKAHLKHALWRIHTVLDPN